MKSVDWNDVPKVPTERDWTWEMRSELSRSEAYRQDSL